MGIRVWGSSGIYILICLYGPNMGYMLIWAKIAEVEYYLCGFFLPAGMRVWVVYTHSCTRIRDGYKNSSNNVPAGAKCLPYPPSYRVKPVGYSGFKYPLPFWVVSHQWPLVRHGPGLVRPKTSILSAQYFCNPLIAERYLSISLSLLLHLKKHYCANWS